jgi:hypothetical protein
VLWVIGVDEATGEVVGAAREDLAAWWAQVQAEFDELAPAMDDLIVVLEGKPVLSLVFATDRVPHLVKNPQGGTVQFEVPWRTATGVRTARRSELLRLLARQQLLPTVEVLDARIYEYQAGSSEARQLSLDLALYVTPRDEERIVIPHHRCSMKIEFDGGISIEAHIRRISPPTSGDFTQAVVLTPLATPTGCEIILDGPSEVGVEVFQAAPVALPDADATVSLWMSPTGHEDAVVVSARLCRTLKEGGKPVWFLEGAPRNVQRFSRD